MTLAQSRDTGTDAELLVGPADDPDRYVLDRRVAVDREASVWHGLLRIEELAVDVRLRVTHPEAGPYLERDGTIRRWRWQAELVNSLDHPALERVRDIFVGRAPRLRGGAAEGRSLVLVTNWIGGERLDATTDARTDATALVSTLRQIADVVDRLHHGVGGRAIVHRTLCPSTITVDRGRVHLEGLGSARPRAADLGAVPGVAATWTPPEVLKGRAFGPAGDRWCVGALAHLLLTGSPPPLLSPAETVDALLDAPLLRRDPALVGHVLRLLTPEPKLRPGALLPWVDELAALLSAPAATPPLDAGEATESMVLAFAEPPAPDELPRRRAGARAISDPNASDPRSSLLLEWDPEALAPLLPCTREHGEPPKRQRTLARTLLPYAAALASVAAVASVVIDTGEPDAPAAQPGAVAAPADPAAAPNGAPAGEAGAEAGTAGGAASGETAGAGEGAGVAAQPGAAAGLILDTFDQDGRAGLGGGPLAWSTPVGTWEVRDGAAVPTEAAGPGVALATFDSGDVPVMVSTRVTDLVPGTGVNARFSSSSTYWAFVHLPAPDGNWQIIRVSPDGVEAVGTFTGPDGPDASIALRMEGTQLIGVVDGSEVGRVDDPREADVSRVGIGTTADGVGQVAFDNVRLTSDTDG